MRVLVLGNGAREHALGTQCVFQPALADVREWLREIDVFVLPSLSEALSNSLLEAMASGCTVVASRVGGNPELVQDGKTGLLFTPGDADDLARQLRSLTGSASLRKQLSENSLSFVRENFNKDVSVQRMQNLYQSFLGDVPQK